MYSLIFMFALCCHSNATRAPIANPPNSAQLRGIPYHSPKLHPGPCNSVGMWPWTDRQTDKQTDRQTGTQTHVTTIHFMSSMTHAKSNKRLCKQNMSVLPAKSNNCLSCHDAIKATTEQHKQTTTIISLMVYNFIKMLNIKLNQWVTLMFTTSAYTRVDQ